MFGNILLPCKQYLLKQNKKIPTWNSSAHTAYLLSNILSTNFLSPTLPLLFWVPCTSLTHPPEHFDNLTRVCFMATFTYFTKLKRKIEKQKINKIREKKCPKMKHARKWMKKKIVRSFDWALNIVSEQHKYTRPSTNNTRKKKRRNMFNENLILKKGLMAKTWFTIHKIFTNFALDRKCWNKWNTRVINKIASKRTWTYLNTVCRINK